MQELTIDVFSDVICPWCFIGARRLDQALEPLARNEPDGVRAHVTFRPFLLDPSTPPEGADLRARLRAKYGADPERMFANVEAAARSSGIPLDFSKVRRTPPTIAAHTLLRHAAARGTQHDLAVALFEAYFLEGKDIGDPAQLAAIAARQGFDDDEARLLAADDRELRATRLEADDAVARGVRAVPLFVFGGRTKLSGAQPPDILRQAIEGTLHPTDVSTGRSL
jgi:predicted DsbA family dithiol-disulfide isomerase